MSEQQDQLETLMASDRTDIVRKRVATLLVRLISYNRMLSNMPPGELREWVETRLDQTILRARELLDSHKECLGV
jgi:hypothetical protein